MGPSSGFIPKQQFHILVSFKGDERSIAVLPNATTGKFLVVDQGNTLGLLQFNKDRTCILHHGNFEPEVLGQLTEQIKDHYSLYDAVA